MNTPPNIYKMNDCDWVAAPSLREACEFYLREFSDQHGLPADMSDAEISKISSEELDNPHQIPEDMLDALLFDPDSVDPVTLKHKTFRQTLAKLVADGREFPLFFASTES